MQIKTELDNGLVQSVTPATGIQLPGPSKISVDYKMKIYGYISGTVKPEIKRFLGQLRVFSDNKTTLQLYPELTLFMKC